MFAGNVFVNNYQKYFLINAFLSIQLDSIRCDAKRSLSLNFFLIDFSRANLGMHWQQARPEAPMPRCTCPSSGGSPALWQLFVRFLSTFPKLSVCRNLCAFSTVFFSVLLSSFCIFCNFFWKCATCHSTNSLQCLLFPFFSFSLCSTPTYMHPICRVPCHSTRH